jgi:hypothetical protein
MMQMLAAGGMPVLTDSLRAPDENNPLGYFEFEPIKATRRDSSWVRLAEGKAVKVVYALLRNLPAWHEYRVIMMHRDLAETIASQRQMLRSSGRAGADVSDERLRDLFAREMAEVTAWLDSRIDFKVLDVQHRDCLENPATTAAVVNTFLGDALNETAMAAAVDPDLHRHRR